MKGRSQIHWDLLLSAEIKLRAERRVGEIIQEGERQGRGHPEKTSRGVTLSDPGHHPNAVPPQAGCGAYEILAPLSAGEHGEAATQINIALNWYKPEFPF